MGLRHPLVQCETTPQLETVMSVEMTTVEQFAETYSDFYKEVNGFRPRQDTSDWTLDDWKKEFDYLQTCSERKRRDDAESEAMLIAAFHDQVANMVALGAKDEAAAIRWLADAEGCTAGGFTDYEHLDYQMGVPFGFTAARLKGNGKPMTDDQKRLVEINEEIRYMSGTYEGCDWCCGGGDERMASLTTEREALITRLAA